MAASPGPSNTPAGAPSKSGPRRHDHDHIAGDAEEAEEGSIDISLFPHIPLLPHHDEHTMSYLDTALRALEAKAAASPTPCRDLDPRPDLTDDASAWRRLLELAHRVDCGERDGVYGALLGMRCLGVRLTTTTVGTLRLEPRAQIASSPPGWAVTFEQYRAERDRWLAPHRAKVIALLAAAKIDEAPV
jgi:hypothetical protein